jgi:hypothetical protein
MCKNTGIDATQRWIGLSFWLPTEQILVIVEKNMEMHYGNLMR